MANWIERIKNTFGFFMVVLICLLISWLVKKVRGTLNLWFRTREVVLLPNPLSPPLCSLCSLCSFSHTHHAKVSSLLSIVSLLNYSFLDLLLRFTPPFLSLSCLAHMFCPDDRDTHHPHFYLFCVELPWFNIKKYEIWIIENKNMLILHLLKETFRLWKKKVTFTLSKQRSFNYVSKI